MSKLQVPELIVPEQFFDNDGLDGSPEADLRLAVLEDALECLSNKKAKKSQKDYALYIEARRWVQSDDETWLFAFIPLCESLGLDPDYMREGLMARIGRGKWKPQERRATIQRAAKKAASRGRR